jgi:UDP-N-acetyl-D-mannosaminuronic acid dehydrogenase
MKKTSENENSIKKICVVGMGYVGIPVALLVADSGFECAGIEISKEKVASLNRGEYPIEGEEPGIPELLKKAVASGKFKATADYSACKDSDIIIICVQTPFYPDRHEPNYSYLKSAVESVGANMKKGALVIIESTIAPGTMKNVVIPILEKGGRKAGKDFGLVHCPERVTPGRLIKNLTGMDRIVGSIDSASTEKAIDLYEHFIKAKLHPVDMTTAEIVKTAENTYRDVEIAFANELAIVCERLGVDFYRVRELVNTAPYRHVHLPGVGVGGHCIPKDPWLLMYGVGEPRPKLFETARNINDSMPAHTLGLVKETLKKAKKELKGAKVAMLGITYMEESDDMRNAPGLVLHELLAKEGAEIRVCDPFAKELPGVKLIPDWREALKGADCILVVTAHSAFKEIREKLPEARKLVLTPVIVDGRKLFAREECERAGFSFVGIGRKK